MHYIVTGCDGKLGGRTAKLMLQQVAPADLTFTCSFLDRLDPGKKARWESLGVKVCQANYDDPDEMVKAFAGGDRIFIVSAVTIGEIRVRQHKNVVDAALAAGVKHITYTSFLGASDPAYAHVYVTPDHTATEGKATFVPKDDVARAAYFCPDWRACAAGFPPVQPPVDKLNSKLGGG